MPCRGPAPREGAQSLISITVSQSWPLKGALPVPGGHLPGSAPSWEVEGINGAGHIHPACRVSNLF